MYYSLDKEDKTLTDIDLGKVLFLNIVLQPQAMTGISKDVIETSSSIPDWAKVL